MISPRPSPFNMGQTCVAPDYVFCPRPAVDGFVAAFTSAVGSMYPTMAENSQYTGIVNEKEVLRIDALVEDAEEKGPGGHAEPVRRRFFRYPQDARSTSKAKGVLYKFGFNSGKLIYPPYGKRVHRLIYRFLMK